MQGLHQTDADFLTYIASQEPQGAFLKQIAVAVHLSIQNAYRYAKKLLKRELIRKDERGLYHLTEQGKTQLNAFRSITHVGVARVPPESIPESFSSHPAEQATNLHALQAHYLIYPTSYSRLEATLNSLGIQYRKSGNPKHPIYTLAWNDISLRIGSKQLIAYGPRITEPISIIAPKIVDHALKRNVEQVVAFLRETNIRIQETIDHKPIVNVPYYELAIVNNDAAEQYAKKHHYIPLAYDPANGRATIWLDGTPAPGAFETNKNKNHEQLRQWGQGIEDGVIRPYSDEMLHREQEQKLWNNQERTSNILLEYAKQLNAHIPVLEKMDKVLELDIKLKEAQLRRASRPPKAQPDSSRQARLPSVS